MWTKRVLPCLLGLAVVLPAAPAAAVIGNGPPSMDWHAWIEAMPGKPSRLVVEGYVQPGKDGMPTLSDERPQGFNPSILLLDLQGAGGGGDAYETVRFERLAHTGQYTEVDIFIRRKMIVRIPVGTQY